MEVKNIFRVLVGVAVLGGIFLVAAYLLEKNSPENQPVNVVVEEPAKTELTGLEAAQRMVGYIDTQRATDGYFNLLQECTRGDEPVCTKPVAASHDHGDDHDHGEASASAPVPHYGQIILAYDAYATVTNSADHQEKFYEIMNVIVEDCLGGNLTVCEWNYYPLYKAFKDTGDQRYFDSMLKVADVIADPKITYENAISKNIGIKLWMLYDLTKDESYKTRLVELADMAVQKFPAQPVLVTEMSTITKVTESMLVPAHKATGDQRYLEVLEQFYATNDLHKYVNPPNALLSSQEILRGIETLHYLSENASKNKDQYKDAFIATMQELLQYRVDFSESKHTYTGDGGMLQSQVQHSKPSVKDTFATGTFVQYLLKVPEYKFVISSGL